MKNVKRKILSVLIALLMASTSMTITVYADPDTGTTGSAADPVVQPVEPVQPIEPVQPAEPQVIEPYNPDVQQNPDDGNNQQGDNTQGSQINYDADYYNSLYGGNIINYDLNDVEFQSAINDTYNPGMTFEEFEKATDYQYATVSPDKVVDMYNSNGSTSAQTLSAKDWQDISLNFDNRSLNGTGDFSFIKDNDSKEDSNFSVLFLIFGIVFVAVSVTLVFYMIISSVRRRKRVKAAAAVSENVADIPSAVSAEGTDGTDLNAASEK